MKLGLLMVLLFAALLNFRGLDQEKYEGDEALWILQGQKYWPLFRDGQWDRRDWTDLDSSWGTPNPPVAKYIFGLALSAQNVQWKWDNGNPPPPSVLTAARRSSAVAGLVGCAGLFAIGFQSLSTRAALYSALLLAASPAWIVASRHAMTDVHGATLAILSVVPFLLGLKELEGKRRALVTALWIALCGVLAGLAVGAKLNAASAPAALGTVLLMFFIRKMVSGRKREAGLLFTLGILFAGFAAGTFVLVNPYLHQDPWVRFIGMIDYWTRMTTQRVALAEAGTLTAFLPQGQGVRVFFGKLAMPLKSIAFLLMVPLAGALWTLWLNRRSRSSTHARLIAWLLLLGVAIAIAIAPNQILHPWILWFGFLGALISLGLPPVSPRRRLSWRAFAVIVWGIVAAFFVWRMTFIPWTRYYIPALAGICLLAGYGLAVLRENLSKGAGGWLGRFLDAAVILGAVSVAVTFPNYGEARTGMMGKSGFTMSAILLWFSIASIGLALAFKLGIRAFRPQDPEIENGAAQAKLGG